MELSAVTLAGNKLTCRTVKSYKPAKDKLTQIHKVPDAIFLFAKADVIKASSKQSPSETVFTSSMSFSAAW